MPEPFVGSSQHSWLGGVNSFVPAHLLGQDESVQLQNGDVFGSMTLRRRPGLNSFLTALSSLTHDYRPVWMGQFTIPGKGPRLAILANRDANTSRLLISDGNSSGVLTIPGLHIFGPDAECVVFADRLYVLDPTAPKPSYWRFGQAEMRYDEGGTTGMPQATTGCYFQSRGYVAGDPNNRRALYYSLLLGNVDRSTSDEQTGDLSAKILDWHRLQSVLMETGDIVKVVPFHNLAILVFTERGIETFEPNGCSILESVHTIASQNFGCASKHSVRVCGEDVLFVDQDFRVRSLKQSLTDEQQGVTNVPISLKIEDVSRRVTPDRGGSIRSAFFKGFYLVGFPVDGARHANEWWACSIRDGFKWTGPFHFAYDESSGQPPPVILESARLRDNVERCWAVLRSGTDVVLAKAFVGLTDLGTAIPWRFDTREFDDGVELGEKEWQSVHIKCKLLDAGSSDQTLNFALQARLDGQAWQTQATLGFGPMATPLVGSDATCGLVRLADYPDFTARVPLTGLGQGRHIQFRLETTDTVSRFELLQIAPISIPNNPRMDNT